MSGTTFNIGDRVFVTDPGLASLRDIMRRATGTEPEPNHHGTIAEDFGDGMWLIHFDDGAGAPYSTDEMRHLASA